MLSISLIFMPAFPLWRVAGAAALGGLGIPHGQQHFQIILLAPHQDGTNKVGDVVTTSDLGRPLGRFPVGLARKTCLASISWGILDTWPNQRSWDLSIRRSGSTFRALRFSQLRTLSRSVTPLALHKNPIAAACPWNLLFRSLPKIQDHW